MDNIFLQMGKHSMLHNHLPSGQWTVVQVTEVSKGAILLHTCKSGGGAGQFSLSVFLRILYRHHVRLDESTCCS